MRVRRLRLTVVAVVGLTLPLAGWAQPAPTGDAGRGGAAFKADGCWECHGTTGAGGGWQGPRIAPYPIGWPAFAAQLRHPRARMPPYSDKVLTDADMADVYAYLRSIPAGPPASQIDLLRP